MAIAVPIGNLNNKKMAMIAASIRAQLRYWTSPAPAAVENSISGVADRVACRNDVAIDAAYRPRRPEESPLYAAVAGHLESFLAIQRERDRYIPGFVEREFRDFLDCGVLARGFLRLHCSVCGLDRVVPYSCKRRGFCNSCGGRRMADTAAHLIDRVFPRVPVRQWVLSFPHALRYRLAYDAGLVTDILDIFTRTVFASMIGRAREFGATRKAQCGAVTFIQRFDSSLGLNVHLHMLAIDGVYAADDNGDPQFQALLAPDNEEIERLAALLAEPGCPKGLSLQSSRLFRLAVKTAS